MEMSVVIQRYYKYKPMYEYSSFLLARYRSLYASYFWVDLVSVLHLLYERDGSLVDSNPMLSSLTLRPSRVSVRWRELEGPLQTFHIKPRFTVRSHCSTAISARRLPLIRHAKW